MEEYSHVPIQCVTLDPLHNTPARLMIGDIIKLRSYSGSHSLFMYKSHPINSVDILGLVTSLKRKEDSWVCNLDDGTGSIQCFCPIKSTLSTHLELKTLSTSLKKRLGDGNKETTIVLGDFVRLIGNVKKKLWSDTNYVSHCSWDVLRRHNMDEFWLQSFREQVRLYEEIYDKPFVVNKEMLKSAKAFLSKEIRESLLKNLDPIITDFISDPENTSSFHGYEIFELDAVKQIMSSYAPQPITAENLELLNRKERHVIVSNAIAALLHKHVASGVLMKKKCFSHEAVTSMDQLDARYFVTANCKLFLNLVQNAVSVLAKQNKPITGCEVLQLIENYDFNFVRYYKHGVVVVENALKALGIEFYE